MEVTWGQSTDAEVVEGTVWALLDATLPASTEQAFDWFAAAAGALDLTGSRMAQTSDHKRYLPLRAFPDTEQVWFSIMPSSRHSA